MNIKEIVTEYNKKELKENQISKEAIANAEKLEQKFKENNIKGYDIVPSPLGEISFEWTNDSFSFGISVNGKEIATLEHVVFATKECFIAVYNINDDAEVFELLEFATDILKSYKEKGY